jgi:hypothetical protein
MDERRAGTGILKWANKGEFARAMAENYRHAMERVCGSPDDRNKIDLYEFASGALGRSAGVSAEVAQGWLLNVIGESDVGVLLFFAGRLPVGAAVAQHLNRTLLQLTMHYRKDERSKGRWQRELSAYLETGGKTVRSQQNDELDWSELPGDVRQIALSSQSREIDVQLWPIKAQNQRIGG